MVRIHMCLPVDIGTLMELETMRTLTSTIRGAVLPLAKRAGCWGRFEGQWLGR